MSKAMICDKCKIPFAEQNGMHIEIQWMFVKQQYDLCPACGEAFRRFLNPDPLREAAKDGSKAD